MSKSELWWVSIGGNVCEPARVMDHALFTIGCPDGISKEGPGVILVEKIEYIPDTPAQREAKRRAWERKVAEDEKRGIHHGYRRFS